MDVTLWAAIGLLSFLLEIITLSGFFICVTVAAIVGGVTAVLNVGPMWSIVAAAAFFMLVRWLSSILGSDAALLRYEEAAHNLASDDGDMVHIAHWNQYGETLVEYQNRAWPVSLVLGRHHRAGDYRVVEVKDSHLIVAPLGERYWPKRRWRRSRSAG